MGSEVDPDFQRLRPDDDPVAIRLAEQGQPLAAVGRAEVGMDQQGVALGRGFAQGAIKRACSRQGAEDHDSLSADDVRRHNSLGEIADVSGRKRSTDGRSLSRGHPQRRCRRESPQLIAHLLQPDARRQPGPVTVRAVEDPLRVIVKQRVRDRRDPSRVGEAAHQGPAQQQIVSADEDRGPLRMSQPPAVADGTGEQIGPDLLPASQTVQPSADPREDLLRKTVRREYVNQPARRRLRSVDKPPEEPGQHGVRGLSGIRSTAGRRFEELLKPARHIRSLPQPLKR